MMSQADLIYKEGDEPVPGYRLVKQLGGGGVGKAWKAIAPGGVDLAIKIVDRLQEGGGRRELQGLEQIKNIPHNYVCRIFGFWAKNARGQIVEPLLNPVPDSNLESTTWATNEETEAVQLVIAMELGDETLADVYARCRKKDRPEGPVGIPVEQLLRHIETAGSAVDYLNCLHHICHCDIKPQNILIIGGEAKICDFGLARHVVDSKETGTPAYTPQYGAPEMMVGATYHPRMDQYSLALTYAELRMGRFPFPAYTEVKSHSKLAALAREKWEGRHDLSGLPVAEKNVLTKALSPKPDDRFESIGEMLTALRAAVFPPRSDSRSGTRPPTKTSIKYREGDEPVPGYRLTEVLGEGAVGETWRATGPGGVDVAVKIVNRLQDGGGRRELLGLERIKNIRHNHLCKIYGYWTKDAEGQTVEPGPVSYSAGGLDQTAFPDQGLPDAVQLVIAMELGDETLADLFARQPGGIPVDELFGYIESAGKAVDLLNQRYHICHCDLKPQNILLVGGEAKVCDFGLARQVMDAKKTSTPAYTPQYGAPEMMVGATYHPRMDQYSLALTYTELRSGRFPFPAFSRPDSDGQLAALAREKWEGKHDLSDLPKAERRVLAKALSPDPDDRFETIADMLDALERAIYAPSSSWVKRFAKSALVGLLLVCLLLVGWKVWPDIFPPPPNGPNNRVTLLVNEAEASLDAFDRDGRLTHLDETWEHFQQIPLPHQSDSRATDLKQRLTSGYYRLAQDALREFSRDGELSDLKEVLTGIHRVRAVDPAYEPVVDLYRQCMAVCLDFADRHLKEPDVEAAEEYLKEIDQHQNEHAAASSPSLDSRWALYHARICAVRKDWEGVQRHLGQVESDALPVPSEDRARLRLLQVQLAVATKRESLVGEADMANLESLRPDWDRLEAWEKTEARRIDAIGGELTDQARLDSSYDSWSVKRKQLAEELWPVDDGFRTVFASCLAWARSDLAENWRKAREGLPELRKLAQTQDDQWHILVLEFLLNLKAPLDSDSPDVVMSRFQQVFETEVPPASPVALADLFEALAARLEGDLRQRKTELLGLQQTRRMLSQDAVQTGPHGDSPDRRLRVLAIIAALGDNATNAATIRTLAKPLLDWVVSEDSADGTDAAEAERPWKAPVAAAWIEAALAPGQEEAFNEAQRQGIVDVVRRAPLDDIYGDYLDFVQSLLVARDDGKHLEAASQLVKLFESDFLSPPLTTVRCRLLAVHLLADAIDLLRTPGADGITTEVFTAENAASASKYLDLIGELRTGVSNFRQTLPDNLVLVCWAANRPVDYVHDLADRRLNQSKSGPILAVRARAARRLLELEGESKSDETRDRVLRAHAGFLEWLFESDLTSNAIDIQDQFLDEAVRSADLDGLEELLQKLSIEDFVRQVLAPEGALRERVDQVREREAVGQILWWHGRRLRRRFDETEPELRRVLHALVISKWLAPGAECLVELGETLLRLPSRREVSGLDDVILSLVDDALQLSDGFHGALGLRARVKLLRSRGFEHDQRVRSLEDAIVDYQQAESAVLGQQDLDLDPFRARYLVGLSAAHVDLAFLAAANQKPFGCDDREEVRARRETLLDQARRYATDATGIERRADAPEEAWIAKGHAEEDLAWHVRKEELYAEAMKSFQRAEKEAARLRRQSAEAFFALGRCRLRQVVRQKPADGADVLRQEVINSLTKAADGVSEDHPSLPEIHHQLGGAYLCLHENYKAKDDGTQKSIMAAYQSAFQAAARVAAGRRSMYQARWAEAAALVGDDAKAEQLARELLEQAEAWQASPDERYSVLMLLLRLAEKEGGPPIQGVRALVQEELHRFPEDNPLHAWRRVDLLYNLSVVTREVTQPPDPLFDAALTDAQTAHRLLERSMADRSCPLFGPSERHFLLWKTEETLGGYYYWKWFLSKDFADVGRDERRRWRLQEIRYLSQALHNFSQYQALCKTLPPEDIRSASNRRLELALTIRDVLNEFGKELDPGQAKEFRQLGHDTTNALRGVFPADSEDNKLVEGLRTFFN